MPSLEVVLEQFSLAALRKWRAAGRNLETFSHSLFFGLERHRAANAVNLVNAIQSQLSGPFAFKDWVRVVDYRYSLDPLSIWGSTRRDGGRFNIGSGIDPSTYTPFPALYIAEDFETAFRERFGIGSADRKGGLTATELALRQPSSFSSIRLCGNVETVLDVGDRAALVPVASLLATFKMPTEVRAAARALNLRPPNLVRSPGSLQAQLLHPDWRSEPVQYDMPSNSQIFGRLCQAAGAHGIVYPSSRNASKRCLALFPQNWRGGGSFIQIADPVPSKLVTTRLDGSDS